MWLVQYYDACDCRERESVVEAERLDHAVNHVRLTSGKPIGTVVVRSARWLGSLNDTMKVSA